MTRGKNRGGLPELIKTAERLLEAVSQGIALVCDMSPEKRNSFEGTRELSRFLYRELDVKKRRSTGEDAHIVRGLFRYGGEKVTPDLRNGRVRPRPRLTDLIFLHCAEANAQSDDNSTGTVLVPSPFHVAIEALTFPEESHTRAYAILAYRLILSKRLGIWPKISFSPPASLTGKWLDEAEIVEVIRSSRKFLEHRDNASAKVHARQFVLNFFAAKGILYLRLKRDDVGRFLRSSLFLAKASTDQTEINPEFRLSRRYRELPQAAALMNEMLGVPLPIRGAEAIFYNGLKPSAEGTLVLEISGGAGTGKTTFCLALAAAFAPMGTHTLYLSFEESPADLRIKLQSQSHPRLKRLSYGQDKELAWFKALKLPSLTLAEFESQVLHDLEGRVSALRRARQEALAIGRVVPPLPLLVVVDSISAIDTSSPGTSSRVDLRQRLSKFVNECQKLGALVVLVSSAKTDQSDPLDYLVDVATVLRMKHVDDHEKKALRLFTLSKSRHQLARHGTHVFHLSGESGFRFSPQLASQMDVQHVRQHMLWDPLSGVELFNVYRDPETSKPKHVSFLTLPVRSSVLLHGRGSGGKAGLALKIALSPRFRSAQYEKGKSPRVLVVSFLYPQSYYDNLRRKILAKFVEEQPALASRGFDRMSALRYQHAASKIDVLQFAPGFLAAEDLYSKLARALEAARLEGQPYTHVVIDGLHNLALQFPGSQEADVLWPIIYGTLTRADVTTITTFTRLELVEAGQQTANGSSEENLFRLRTHLPLLHALTQASDFVIELSKNPEVPLYQTKFHSSVNREPPRKALQWDRLNSEFVGKPIGD